MREKKNIIYQDPPWWYADRHFCSKFGGGASRHYPLMRDAELLEFAKGVKDLAADQAVLYTWATWPRLDFAMEFIKACGFKYSTLAFLWVKLNPKPIVELGGSLKETIDEAFKWKVLSEQMLEFAGAKKLLRAKFENNRAGGYFLDLWNRIWGIKFSTGYYTRSNTEICLLAQKKYQGKVLPVLDHSISQMVFAPVEAHSKKPDIFRELIVRLHGDLPRVELFARQETPGWDAMGNEVD